MRVARKQAEDRHKASEARRAETEVMIIIILWIIIDDNNNNNNNDKNKNNTDNDKSNTDNNNSGLRRLRVRVCRGARCCSGRRGSACTEERRKRGRGEKSRRTMRRYRRATKRNSPPTTGASRRTHASSRANDCCAGKQGFHRPTPRRSPRRRRRRRPRRPQSWRRCTGAACSRVGRQLSRRAWAANGGGARRAGGRTAEGGTRGCVRVGPCTGGRRGPRALRRARGRSAAGGRVQAIAAARRCWKTRGAATARSCARGAAYSMRKRRTPSSTYRAVSGATAPKVTVTLLAVTAEAGTKGSEE
ncbi:hypothetical protein T492DRAFT_115451 [Pavlovales sp. CCMP2436]|nr:hypothetical protein T492DRAFT_115451 [Pavlovales sp. CCMP2436]